MIFDTHAHYDDEAFDGDRPELLGRLKEAGVGAVMNVAASLGSCRSTLKLAEAYDWIYGAMGVWPPEDKGRGRNRPGLLLGGTGPRYTEKMV